MLCAAERAPMAELQKLISGSLKARAQGEKRRSVKDMRVGPGGLAAARAGHAIAYRSCGSRPRVKGAEKNKYMSRPES